MVCGADPVTVENKETEADVEEVRPKRGPRAATQVWFARTFESLKDRHLRILWLGTLLNFGGVTMHMTAQNVVAFDIANSNRAVGTVMLGTGLSMLFISPFAGTLADRLSKRMLLIVCQIITGSTFLFVGIAIAGGFLTIFMLAASAFVTGVMFAIIRPVRNAYIGELATRDQRGNAVAVQQLALSVMMVAGPFFAAILLGWSAVGAAGTYFVMAGAFFVALLMMVQLPGPPDRSDAEVPSFLSDTWLGLKYGWAHAEIRWVLAGFLLLTIFGMPFATVLPAYAENTLGVSTSSLGVLLGLAALGGLLVSIVAASLADSPHAPRFLAACNILFAAGLAGLAVAPNFAVACAVVIFLGAGSSGFQVLNLAIALRAADVAYMGRVAGLTMMASSVSGLSAFPVGALADRYGERELLMAMGISVLVVTFVLVIWREISDVETIPS